MNTPTPQEVNWNSGDPPEGPIIETEPSEPPTHGPGSLIEALPAYRAHIAELRKVKCDLTASIMRDEVLAQLEAWLDPDGAAHTKELHRIQGRAALALALERIDGIPF